MAAPVDAARAATTAGSTAATNKACVLPASIAAGHRLILVIRSAGADTHSLPAGWEWLVENNTDDGSNDTTSIMWKVATGSEGASVTVNCTASLKWSAVSWRITGAGTPEISPIVTGPTTTPNPPAYRPSWGTQEYLWLWVGAWEGEQTSPPAGAPTNYSNAVGSTTGTGGAVATNCRVAGASRALTAIEEDPPSWTISVSDNTSAWTIAIAPATMVGAVPKKRTHVVRNDRVRRLGQFRSKKRLAPLLRAASLVPLLGSPITPDVGALTLTGFAPTVQTPVSVTPGVGQLTLDGYVATVSTPVAVTPDVGQLLLTGFAPSVSTASGVQPDVGSLVLDGFAPSVTIVAPDRRTVATHVLTSPRVRQHGELRGKKRFGTIVRSAALVPPGAPITVSPDVGQLTLEGFAPTIGIPVVRAPRDTVKVLTGRHRAEQRDHRRRANAIIVSIAYQSAPVGADITPDVGQLALTGFAPTVATPVALTPGTGQLTLTGFSATVAATVDVRPDTGSLSLSGFSPTVQAPRNVTAGLGQLSLTGFAPTVAAGTSAQTGTGQLSLTGFAPTVATTGHQNVVPGTGALTLSGHAPTAATPRAALPATGQLMLSGFAPSVATAVVVRPGTGELALSGFAPGIEGTVVIRSAQKRRITLSAADIRNTGITPGSRQTSVTPNTRDTGITPVDD